MPVMLLLFPVIAPPKVKALMVRVPVELAMLSVWMYAASRPFETEALVKEVWPDTVKDEEAIKGPATSNLLDTEARERKVLLLKVQAPEIV